MSCSHSSVVDASSDLKAIVVGVDPSENEDRDLVFLHCPFVTLLHIMFIWSETLWILNCLCFFFQFCQSSVLSEQNANFHVVINGTASPVPDCCEQQIPIVVFIKQSLPPVIQYNKLAFPVLLAHHTDCSTFLSHGAGGWFVRCWVRGCHPANVLSSTESTWWSSGSLLLSSTKNSRCQISLPSPILLRFVTVVLPPAICIVLEGAWDFLYSSCRWLIWCVV